jgi:two-component system nitrogen regulation sensor histidine kinase GlnL
MHWSALLFLGAILLIIAVYGWRSAPQAAVNRRFAIQTLVVTSWVIGIAGARSGYAAEFWGRWIFASAAVMAPAFLAFAEAFPTPEHSFPARIATPIRRVVSGAALAFGSIAATTPLIIHDVKMRDGVLTRSAGPLLGAFIAFIVLSGTLTFVVLVRKWRRARGIARAQLRLYCFGLLVFAVGAITTNLLYPALTGESRYSTLGPCFILVFLAFVAHGIIRHRLMNLRLVIHNWLTIAIASGASVLPVLLALTTLEAYRRSAASWFGSALPVLIAALLGPPLWLSTRYLLHRYVYRGDADFRTQISEASDRLSQVLAPAETARVVIDTVFAAVKPEGAAVYTRGTAHDDLILVSSRAQRRSFGVPDALPRSLSAELGATRLIASFQSVPAEPFSPPSHAIARTLEENQWALVIALVADSEAVGAVALGGKLSGAPYYLEDLRLLRVLGSQASVALQNSRLYERVLLATRQIENIVATIQNGIVVAHDRETVRLLNSAAVTLLGLDGHLTAPISVPSKELPEPLTAFLIETLESGQLSRTVDLVVATDRHTVPLMCTTAPLRGTDGTTAGIVASLSDLTTLRALETARGRAERLNYFEMLAAGLAHEIGNPIVPIKLMTQLLPSRHLDSRFIEDFTRTVTRETSRIQHLVNRLRSLSGPSSREARPVDLRTILRDCAEVIASLVEEKRLSVDIRMPSNPVMILGDPNELHELFLNLLTNAVEATEEGGIVVEAVCQSSEAEIHVADSGPGIPPEVIGRMFEPFVSSKKRGSGLGLAICHGIVDRHKGTLIGTNTDRGALFTVRFPVAIVE